MKNFQPIRIYKFLLDFLWYGFLVFAFGWILTNIISIAFKDVVTTGKLFNIEVQYKAPNSSLPKFSEVFDFSVSKQTKIELRLNNFTTTQLSSPFILLSILSFLIAGFLTMFQVKLLRDFLRNILNEKIFIEENTRKLTQIALIELLTIPVSIGYCMLMSAVLANYNILSSNLEFEADYTESLEPLFRALEYFLFAGIFAFGYKLKQENEQSSCA